ncbi:MAG: hypothetical protein J0H61_02240 [Alphaproteobacteria bacterium]|nr:hypothetical protein [Alphaproteobacteria bacterium]
MVEQVRSLFRIEATQNIRSAPIQSARPARTLIAVFPTAAELAANFAIRKEFTKQSQLRAPFVDSLLVWANGLQGKIQRLLLPITKGRTRLENLKELQKLALKVNKTRNGIAHQGAFCDGEEAKAVIEDARKFIEGLVLHYEPDFELVDQDVKRKERR